MLQVEAIGIRHIPRARMLGAYLYAQTIRQPAFLYRIPGGGWDIRLYEPALKRYPHLRYTSLLAQGVGPQLVTVPNLLNLTLSAASALLAGAGLALGAVTSALSPTVPAGEVSSQSPVAGTQVLTGTSIALVISEGVIVTLPILVGLTQTQAQSEVAALGLISEISYTNSLTVPPNIVVTQFPAAGTQLLQGSIVALVISLGPQVAPIAPPQPVLKVTSRNFNLLEMVEREWGASFKEPDHRVYSFGGGKRNFDSTDMGSTGIYRPPGTTQQ
jgi:hypothetical protein